MPDDTPLQEPHPAATPRAEWRDPAVVAHVLPFLVWIGLMTVLNWAGPAAAWKYAVRTGVTVAVLLALRPWRWYGRLRRGSVLPALAVGVGVFVIWVAPEWRGAGPLPLLQELYLRFGIMPLGRLPAPVEASVYDPGVCGWLLSLVRLAGSAFVIATAEEFFWRGFLYRRLQHRDFLGIAPTGLDWEAFLLTCVLFGLEHDRFLAGAVAGLAYGWLMIRTGCVWAAVLAHITTNLLLGIYVLAAGAYAFW